MRSQLMALTRSAPYCETKSGQRDQPAVAYRLQGLAIDELIESDAVLRHQGVADRLNDAHHCRRIGIAPRIVDPIQERGDVASSNAIEARYDFGVDQRALVVVVPNMGNALVSEIDHALLFEVMNQTLTHIPMLQGSDLTEAPVELVELGQTDYEMEETNLLDSDHGLLLNASCPELGIPFVEEHHATHKITHEVVERIGCMDGLNPSLIGHRLPG